MGAMEVVSAGGPGAGALPAGTVTFLFTDLEGSTALLQAHPDAYRDAVARHHDLLRAAVEGHGGAVFETVGDAVYAAFAHAAAAVAAALAGQEALQAAAWRARRVFPLPPAPVSVIRREVPSSRPTSATSRSRPTKLVSCRGRLLGRASSDRRAGNAAGRSGWRS